MTTPTTPMTPSVMMNPMRRVVPTYNSPVGLYSNQNVQDARQAAEAAAGVDRYSHIFTHFKYYVLFIDIHFE